MFPSWFTGRPYTVAARGRLPGSRSRWAAVPGMQAAAFHADHPAAHNALSFAHITRWIAGRYPQDAARAGALLDSVRALEARYPNCVIFVLAE